MARRRRWSEKHLDNNCTKEADDNEQQAAPEDAVPFARVAILTSMSVGL